jgi:hypothetical protein
MARPSGLIVMVIFAGLLAIACSSAPRSSSTGGAGSPGPSSPTVNPTPDPNLLRVSTAGWSTDFRKHDVGLGEFLSGGPPKDGIPAIDKPKYESVAAARDWLTDKSPVISLQVGSSARAYPLAILIWHEIANDTLGGEPVVVTFCPLCNTALVFEREFDGVVHDFGTTSNLRFSDLVMYDRQTESWWQQATGQAIVGQLTGTQLIFVPAQIVSLADFAAAHPDGDVLSRDTGFSRDYGQNPYVGYDTVDQNPYLFDGVLDGRLPPKERVVTVGLDDQAVAFPYSELRKVGVASGSIAGDDFVVFWVPGTASALDGPQIDGSKDVGATGVFKRIVDGRHLTFFRDGGEDGPIRDR